VGYHGRRYRWWRCRLGDYRRRDGRLRHHSRWHHRLSDDRRGDWWLRRWLGNHCWRNCRLGNYRRWHWRRDNRLRHNRWRGNRLSHHCWWQVKRMPPLRSTAGRSRAYDGSRLGFQRRATLLAVQPICCVWCATYGAGYFTRSVHARLTGLKNFSPKRCRRPKPDG